MDSTIGTQSEFHVMREVNRGSYGHDGAEVRAWVPGDGLHCSGGKAGLIACGPPVALWRAIEHSPGRWNPAVRTYVLCANHLARKAREFCGGPGNLTSVATEATRKARERVIANHWDEYQSLFQQYADETRSEWLDLLPESLRAAAQTATEDDDTQAVAR